MNERRGLRRLLPNALVRTAKRMGAGTGYLVVRPEADRIADHLNETVVESFAYVQRRLADMDARLQHLEGPRPEPVLIVVEAAGLPEAAAHARAEAAAGAILVACVLQARADGAELPGWRVTGRHADAERDLLLLIAEAV